jgi:LCP family protein required for cell wall assembly
MKRGAGRFGNGSGSDGARPGAANGAPPRPPLGPTSRYGGRDHRGLRITGRVLMWLLVFLLVAAGALGGGVWLYLEESVATINDNSQDLIRNIEAEGEEDILEEAPVAPDKPTNAIIIGYDARAGSEHTVGLSDTIMLVRADPKTDTISLLSFPRDLQVEHPGCRAHSTPWVGKINEAYALCGPVGTVKTVKQLTGLSFNYVITVNFHGFKELVNKVGGVYVDVDRRYYNPYGGDYARINLQPGYQKLTGGAALDYARFRHTDSDFHRIARQQIFIKSFKQAVRRNFSVTKLPGIIKVFVDSVQVKRGGSKDLDLDTLLTYARFVYDLPSGHFFQVRLSSNDVVGTSTLETSDEAIGQVVRDFLNPDVDASKKATQAASGQKPRTEVPLPSDTTIEVLNGNGEEGSADTAAYLLGQRGYVTEVGGNAFDESGVEKFDYFETTVLYNPEVAGAAAAAESVGKLFGDYVAQEAPPDAGVETMLRVIVGETFHNQLAPAAEDATPEHAPPTTVRDFDDVLAALQPLRGQTDFPLLVPLFKDASSTLDTEVGVRKYRLEGHDAVKIVYHYRGQAGAYWGVMETSWTDAPIVDEPNQQKRAGGRDLRLYYNGSKLHMVAFQENGTLYWVTNTVLDDLSNETMLSIAKGLKPVSAAK